MFLIIAWHPATGKTTLTKQLEKLYPDHTVFHTDDYMEFGYKDSLYKLLEDIKVRMTGGAPYNIIVEWVMGSRLMRKLQEQTFDEYVDLYVYLRGALGFIQDTYSRERPDKDFTKIEATCKGLDTVHDSIQWGTPEKPGTPILVIHVWVHGNYLLDWIKEHLPK